MNVQEPAGPAQQTAIDLDTPVHIFVKNLLGSTLTLEMKLKDSVESLKAKICDRDGIPIAQQLLIFAGLFPTLCR